MVYRADAETLPMPGAEAENKKLHAVPKTRAWRFEGFEFDLLRGELHGENGASIALRPKAEALLRLFLAQPGRLFSRDELMSAVWPAAVVTDDSLVQCVGELRTALGDSTQRLIRTVPRRGYRLEAAVAPVVDAAPAMVLPEPVEAIQPVSLPSPSAADTPLSRRPGTWRSLALVLLAAATVVGGGAAFYLRPTVGSINIDEVIASRNTVAVMPFVVTAAEPQLRGLADSVADGIGAQLATRIGMRGIGRAATMAFDGASPPLAHIAAALKATHVLTGRVAPAGAGERISIDVQIIDVANGQVIWTKHFEASGASDAGVATDVGQRVAIAMRTRGSLPTGIRAAQPGHAPDAAELTVRGWGDLDRRKSLADVQRARTRFEAALREDPRSVIALNGLGASYYFQRIDPMNPVTAEQVAEHERVTDLASKLAPDNDTSLVMWGHMQMMRGRPDLALPAFEKANRLVPSQPGAYVNVATARMLLGRADEVQGLADRAVELGAGDGRRVSLAYLVAAEAALMRGEDERARDFARRAIAELPSNARAHALLAAVDALAGRNEQAATAMATLLELWPAATVARYDELRRSTHPVYLAQRARLYEGLRKAGLPDR